jgi:hypothetical protein
VRAFADSPPAHVDTPPSKWTVAQVGQWLESLGFAQHVSAFKKNEIDGEVLAMLTNDLLKDYVGVGGHRLKIIKARDELFA